MSHDSTAVIQARQGLDPAKLLEEVGKQLARAAKVHLSPLAALHKLRVVLKTSRVICQDEGLRGLQGQAPELRPARREEAALVRGMRQGAPRL